MDKLASWVKWYLPKTHVQLKPQNVTLFCDLFVEVIQIQPTIIQYDHILIYLICSIYLN